MNEQERFNRLLSAEPPPPGNITVVGTSPVSVDALNMIRAVACTVIENRSSGLSMEGWRLALPAWFVSATTDHAESASPERWHFKSWIDGIRQPGWEWWSCGTRPQEWVIHLTWHEFPFRLAALLFLAKLAGTNRVLYTSDVDAGREHRIEL